MSTTETHTPAQSVHQAAVAEENIAWEEAMLNHEGKLDDAAQLDFLQRRANLLECILADFLGDAQQRAWTLDTDGRYSGTEPRERHDDHHNDTVHFP